MYGYSPMQNPYLDRLNSMATPAPVQITKVNGKNGADAFQLPANSSILLLDETQPIVWLKQTDGAGYPTTVPYRIEPYKTPAEPDFKALDERIKRLEDMLNGKPDNAKTKSKSE